CGENRAGRRDLPDLRHLPDPVLPVEERGRPLRTRRTGAEGPPDPADARGNTHPCGPGAVDPGGGRAHHRLSATRGMGHPAALPKGLGFSSESAAAAIISYYNH